MIETSFTIKSINVDQALHEAEKKAEKSAQKIDRTLNQPGGNSGAKTVQETSQAAQKGLDAVAKAGSGVAGVMKNVVGGFTSLLNPISLITAGIGAIIAYVTRLYQKAKEKAEQLKDSMKWDAGEGAKRLDATMKEGNEGSSYMQRLYEINQLEVVDNSTKLEAARIIDLLTKRYGDLGLSIDQTTGRILGLTEAMRRQARLAREQARVELEAQIARQSIVVDTVKNGIEDTSAWKTPQEDVVDVFNPFKPGDGISIPYDKRLYKALQEYYIFKGGTLGSYAQYAPKGWQPSTHETEAVNNLLRQQQFIEDKIKTSTGEAKQSYEEELEILRKIIAEQRVLDLATRMQSNIGVDKDDVKKWRELYVETQTKIAQLMRLRNLVATGNVEETVQKSPQPVQQSPQARERAVASQQDKLTQKRFEVATVGATEGEKYGIVLAQERRQASRVREEEARLKKLIAEYEALQKRFTEAGTKPRKQDGTFVNAEDEQEYKRLESEVEAARRRMQEQEARTVDAEAARLDYQKRLREMEVATQKSLRESNERLAVKREEMRSVGETPAERIGRLKIRSSDYVDSLLIMGDELDEIEDKEAELRRLVQQAQGDKRKEIETQLAELAQERLRKEQEIANTKVAQLDIDKQIREYEINQARQEAARSMQGMSQFFSPALPDLVRRGGSMRGANGPADANLKILNAVLLANRYLQYIRINTANGGVY